MTRRESAEEGWDYLLSLHRQKIRYDNDYWVTMRVTRVPATKGRPHGIRYSLTLHDAKDDRILGYDNAHPIRPPGSGPAVKSKIPERYDHIDRKGKDSVPYAFKTPYDLVADFFAHVDQILNEEGAK